MAILKKISKKVLELTLDDVEAESFEWVETVKPGAMQQFITKFMAERYASMKESQKMTLMDSFDKATQSEKDQVKVILKIV